MAATSPPIGTTTTNLHVEAPPHSELIRVLCVYGTRPEAIKMAPVIRELQSRSDTFEALVCATDQHRDIADQVMGIFGVEPDLRLGIMRPDQSLQELTTRLLTGLGDVVGRVQPDWIVAQGDTTSVLAAAMTAFYARIPFAHVEAGLRTGDLSRPFPEEFNRVVADRVAALKFAPTPRAAEALRAEGHSDNSILMTGNTVIDAIHRVQATAYQWHDGPLACLDRSNRIVLVTVHRRESFGSGLKSICLAVATLAQRYPRVLFAFPVHPNPNVRQPAAELLAGLDNVFLLEPLDYLSFVHLMKTSILIITDSGGVQEEAPAFKVPVLVVREKTERPEGLELGLAKLVGVDTQQIIDEGTRYLSEGGPPLQDFDNPYGDGQAARRIVDALATRCTF